MVLEKKPVAEEEEEGNARGRRVMNGTIVACVRPPVTCCVRVLCAVPGLESTLYPILPQISGGKRMNFIGVLEARTSIGIEVKGDSKGRPGIGAKVSQTDRGEETVLPQRNRNPPV